jgi:hypothetical protein
MYHPYIRQKMVEARAHELERIAEQDRVAGAHAADAPVRRRFTWAKLGMIRRRVGITRATRVDSRRAPKTR